jgi:DNA mismatch endonuclease, patch repair protein
VADTFSPQERSWIMGRVLGRGNASTEQVLVALLREAGLSGWRRHPPLPGNPDFVFHSARVVVFVDGCFWHSCPRHLRLPANNRAYWVRKIERNRLRDRRTTRDLRARGWRVVRIWEHGLRGPSERSRAIARIVRAVGEARRGAGTRPAADRARAAGRVTARSGAGGRPAGPGRAAPKPRPRPRAKGRAG